MHVVKMIVEEGYVSVLTCYADGGSNIRGNSPSADVAERRNTAGKSVRARHGAKAIGSGAAPKMETMTAKMCPIALVVVPMAPVGAVVCGGENA